MVTRSVSHLLSMTKSPPMMGLLCHQEGRAILLRSSIGAMQRNADDRDRFMLLGELAAHHVVGGPRCFLR